MLRASFIDHKVTPEGLYVRGVLSSTSLTPDVEIRVSRDGATQELQQQADTIQRNLTDAKLLLSVLFKDDALSEVYTHICDSLETLGDLKHALNLSPEVSEEA